MSFMKDLDHLRIELEDVLAATNNFDPAKLIGRGGFGNVYKGELSTLEGRLVVAFKQLNRRLGQGEVEFWKEVMMLSKYKHENLITLMHYCIHGDQMILVYEYASRGSLDTYLADPCMLTWIQRLKISIGVARGLEFLHDPMRTHQRLIHRDIKSGNILLDEKLTAKVSDFGLSKVSPAYQQHSYLASHAVGTPGYCDPLYMEFGFLSKESDVYSLGVVLFEILCGRLCCEYHDGKLTKILVAEWRQCYEDGRLDEIILPGLRKQMYPGPLRSFSAIAYKCLKRDPEDRPTMAEVRLELEFSLQEQVVNEKRDEYSQKKINASQDGSKLTPETNEPQFFESRVNDKFQSKTGDDYSQLQPGGGGSSSSRGQDVVHPLRVTLEDLYNRTFRKLCVERNAICDKCKGKCPGCQGSGTKVSTGSWFRRKKHSCKECKGTGETINDKVRCTKCKGKRVVVERKFLEVHVEKGIQNGQKFTFQGTADDVPNMVTGDIVCVLQQQEHPKFRRKGDDLFVEHTLSLTEALRQPQFILTHLDNRKLLIKFKCQSGEVQPDQFKVINNEGMPMYTRPNMRGKLYIHFTVERERVLPSKSSIDMADMKLDECEVVTLHDVNKKQEMRGKQQQAQEAYDERIQCPQQ